MQHWKQESAKLGDKIWTIPKPSVHINFKILSFTIVYTYFHVKKRTLSSPPYTSISLCFTAWCPMLCIGDISARRLLSQPPSALIPCISLHPCVSLHVFSKHHVPPFPMFHCMVPFPVRVTFIPLKMVPTTHQQ